MYDGNDSCENRQRSDSGQHGSGPPKCLGTLCDLQFASLACIVGGTTRRLIINTCCQITVFNEVQGQRCDLCPRFELFQAGTRCQETAIFAHLNPFGGSRFEPTLHLKVFSTGTQPLAQWLPGSDQCFVGNFYRRAAGNWVSIQCQEAVSGEAINNLVHQPLIAIDSGKLRALDAPPGVLSALAQRYQA